MAENIKYLEKLDRSRKELEQGKTISFSMEELKEMLESNVTAVEEQSA